MTSGSTPGGLYQLMTLPFRITNSPAAFNKVMREVMRGIEGVEMFVDDVIQPASRDPKRKSELLRNYNLTIKPSKCLIGHEKVTLARGSMGARVIRLKKSAMLHVLRLKSFLGLAGYYRDHISNCAVKAAPLHEFLKKKKHASNKIQ